MKALKYITLIILISVVGLFPINSNALSFFSEDKESILIDPGHGGVDGGAKSISGVLEKDINLQIANKLKNSLDEKGFKVFLTRENNDALSNIKREDLNLRCKKKKEVDCDIFISIHQNMYPKPNCKGAQIWYASNEDSKSLAEFIQQSIKINLDSSNNRLPKDAKTSYRILKDGHRGGNIIIECGFLSNPEEEKNLLSEEYQEKLVNAIVLGIEKYLEFKKE